MTSGNISRATPVFSETLAELVNHSTAGVKFYVEDGWIFKELPGKGIECVSRAGDAHVVDLRDKMEKAGKRIMPDERL